MQIGQLVILNHSLYKFNQSQLPMDESYDHTEYRLIQF